MVADETDPRGVSTDGAPTICAMPLGATA